MEDKPKASISVPMIDALLNLAVATGNAKPGDEPPLVLPKATEDSLPPGVSTAPQPKPAR